MMKTTQAIPLAALLMGLGLWDPAMSAPAGRYSDCLSETRRDAKKALELAEAWEGEGGGGAARHCLALAKTALGDYEGAAAELAALSEDVETSETASEGAVEAAIALKADLLTQAGNAWLLAADWEKARGSFSAALALLPQGSPETADILVDRAQAFAGAGQHDRALNDLDAALETGVERAEIHLFRAAAHRKLEQVSLAEQDIEAALALDPGNPAILFERGNLRALKADYAAAEADWRHVAEAERGTPLGDAAEANLDALHEASDSAEENSSSTPGSVSEPE